MIVAKRSKSADRLSEQLRNGTLKRSYIALVHGKITAPAIWKHELVKDSKTNLTRAYKEKQEGSRSAVLKVTPLEYRPRIKNDEEKEVFAGIHSSFLHNLDYTLARFDLETGRSHQIRAQAAAEKHPLLGDRKYGSPIPPPYFLHSFLLGFTHPITREPMRFEELPEWGYFRLSSKITPFR
jgi:23S rRNA pseudouridine1911/1915/1917 synthase